MPKSTVAFFVGVVYLTLGAPGASAQNVAANVSAFHNGSYTAGSTVTLLGYNQPGDGGGGLLSSNGTGGLSFGTCMTAQAKLTNGSSLLKNVTPFPQGLAPNMTVTATIGTNTYTFIVLSYSVSGGTITVSPAYTGTGVPLQTIYFTGETGGSTFVNNGVCFTRVNPTFSQKEWGAFSDGQVHSLERQSLQNWLNANQPHIAVPGNSVIDSSLYCAGIDANNSPLTDGSVIQGSPPSSPGVDGEPTFLITAVDAIQASQFTGAAMLIMNQPQCALSATGVIGNPANLYHYDILQATQPHNSMFEHSKLFGGNIGFNCLSAGVDIDIIDSAIVQAALDGIRSACPNMKVQRNVISGNGSGGGDGINYSGSQALIQGNIIEQSGGNGLNCASGMQMAVIGNYFDNNGKQFASTHNLRAGNCQMLSIVGNQFHRSSPLDESAETTSFDTAHIWFDGASDSVSTSGNVFFVGNDTNATEMRPDYDIELAQGASVTNFSFGDSPTPQNYVTATSNGILGPNAAALLAPYLQATVPMSYFNGLGTTMGGTSTQIIIGVGSASDSTNRQTISTASTCQVDLSVNGVGGIDVGGTIGHNTQYNFFVFSEGGNSHAMQCIASTGLSPDFGSAATSGNKPPAAVVNGYVANGQMTIINVSTSPCFTNNSGNWNCPSQNPFGGMAVGDAIADPTGGGGFGYIQPGTTITDMHSLNVPAFSATTFHGSPDVSVSATIAAQLFVGMNVGNAIGTSPIPGFAMIKTVQVLSGMCGTVNAPCFEITTNASGPGGAATLTASGAYTITMSKPAQNGTNLWNGPDAIKVYNERYRLVAALRTDTSGNIIPYYQNGDTFYLKNPLHDVAVGSLNTPLALSLSVPKGFPVEALGRCVGGTTASNPILLYTPTIYVPGTSPGTPGSFATAPGYSMQTLPAGMSFSYRIYTNANGQIQASAGVAGASLDCMTDGWVLHRGPQ